MSQTIHHWVRAALAPSVLVKVSTKWRSRSGHLHVHVLAHMSLAQVKSWVSVLTAHFAGCVLQDLTHVHPRCILVRCLFMDSSSASERHLRPSRLVDPGDRRYIYICTMVRAGKYVDTSARRIRPMRLTSWIDSAL